MRIPVLSTCLLLIAAMPGPLPAAASEPVLEKGTLQRRAPAGSFAETVRVLARETRGPFWMVYGAPLIEGERMMCCYEGNVTKSTRGCNGCRLEEQGGFTINNGDRKGNGHLEGDDAFLVLARVAEGRVGKLRALSMDCALDAGPLPLYWIGHADAAASLAWLKEIALEKPDRRREASDEAVMAIALHRGQEPDRLLASFLEEGPSMELREQAAFWAGTTRGSAGSALLRRVLDQRGDAPYELRKKVIFALSQNEAPESLDALVRAARSDHDPDVRAEAIFWLAQKAGEKAAATLGEAIDDDPDVDVKKKAVFALSQLPADEGVPLLIGVVKRHRHPDVRREALFWLGQSGDPRALAFIEEILNTELTSAPRSSTKVRM
jgi:HEAT repeat protein